MIKVLIMAIVLLPLAACSGNAPPPTQADAMSFSIMSELPDPATSSISINIQFAKSAKPSDVQAAAESVIASRKGQYERITVKSFVEGSNPDGVPLAVSKLEGEKVETVFNTAAGGLLAPDKPVRIPTH